MQLIMVAAAPSLQVPVVLVGWFGFLAIALVIVLVIIGQCDADRYEKSTYFVDYLGNL